MSKKIASLVLAIAMLLGCVGITASAEGEYDVFDWFMDAGALPNTWNLDQPIFKAITDNTNCTPNIIYPADDAGTKLNLMMTSNQLPDLISIMNSDANMNLINEMIDGGLVWDIGEFMETYAPESNFVKQFPEDIKKGVIKRDGGWYCFPSHMVSDDDAKIWGYPEPLTDYYKSQKFSHQWSFFFNKNLMEKIGVDVKTLDTEKKLLDFMEQVKNMNLTNDSGASVYTMLTPPYDTRGLDTVFGVLPFDEDGHYRNMFFDSQEKYALKFLNTCYQRGYLDESNYTSDDNTITTLCNSERCLIYLGGIAGLADKNLDKWVTPGPVMPENGRAPAVPLETAVNLGWIQTVVSKNCKNPEAVAKFIDYMTSRDGMIVHMYGIEGTDYYWDDEGMLHRTELGGSKVEDKVSGMFGFFAFHHTSFSQSVEYVDISNVSDNKTALPSSPKAFRYSISLTQVPTSYVEPGSDMDFIKNEAETYIKTNRAKLVLAKDDATFDALWDEFVKDLEDIGLHDYDAYIDEQVQLNCQEAGVKLTDGIPLE